MNVLMISPGFPDEMPRFSSALAEVGATVYGIGDGPAAGLPEEVRRKLAGYLQVRRLTDEHRVVPQVQEWLRGRTLDRVECLWEPGMLLAAHLRQGLDVPGLTVEQTIPFRDKESMKAKLDAAGIRTPHHYRANTTTEVREAAERVGYPLIIKPIAGAGSADTWEVRDDDQLEEALQRVEHVPEVSVEEFIEGEEYTWDTVSARGDVLFENVAWYRPNPLISRLTEWISPQALCLRDLSQPEIEVGCELGREVLQALEWSGGFAHMEWFRTKSGEAVFGEIGGRSPGGRLVHAMNYSSNLDLFRGWAEAVVHNSLSQDTTKLYNSAVVFKRAQGDGHIKSYEGLDRLLAHHGEHICAVELQPIGAPRRDWRQVVSGDGWIVVRHPDLATTMELADHVGTELRITAG